VNTFKFNGLEAKPTGRFWDSLCSKFGFGPSIFRYFSHAEVFERLAAKANKAEIRLTIAQEADNPPLLLGISNPDKTILQAAAVVEVLNQLKTRRIEYRDGMIVSRHEPRSPVVFDIGGDKHETRLCLETPIDGYGKPNVWLSFLRDKCHNGLVAYSKAFQSSINVGNDDSAAHTLKRVMEAYNNEDGFVAMKQRVTAAQNSWASMFEAIRLAKCIWRLKNEDFDEKFVTKTYNASIDSLEEDRIRNDLLSVLHQKTGDLRAIYGVAQMDSISKKKMRTLPTKAKVYDLINFATETATHCLKPDGSRQLNSYCGDLISQEYDLETSCSIFPEFGDFNIVEKPIHQENEVEV
jgi:hypothetical protein